jgi:four helix bundle protein
MLEMLYYLLGNDGLIGKRIMEKQNVVHFNQKMRLRSKMFAVNIYKTLASHKLNDLSRVPIKQLMRCATSVAANFSSATRGRSEAEFYSKVCIVTEECDECVFWIEFLIETGIVQATEIKILQQEAVELLCIFSTIKKKLKLKRFQ